MSQTRSDAVERSTRKTVQRWMPGQTRQRLIEAARIAGAAGICFLLSFADMMGIPSGLHGAWIMALSACGRQLIWPMCGAALSVPMRLLWGIDPRWDILATLVILLAGPRFVRGKRPWRMTAWTAVALSPSLIMSLSGPAEGQILAIGTLLTGILAAPVMYRAIQVTYAGESITALEERVAVAYTFALILTGGARLALFGVNLGVAGAAAAALCAAMYLGAGAGCITGMMTGLALALQGLPVTLSVSLSVAGFLGGVAQLREKRWITCGSFLCAGLLTLFMAESMAFGYVAGMSVSAAAMAFLPMDGERALMGQFSRFRWEKSDADACCAQQLARWEKTMDALVRQVPMPVETPPCPDNWKDKLCSGCPDAEQCDVMLGDMAASGAAEAAAAFHQPEENWIAALENLRGLGCGRLYYLRERMDQMRQEARQDRRQWQRAVYQRELLVTHLTAMAGAARRFALISTGGTWWDAANARALRQAAAEKAVPATLLYARRVEGHTQAAWEMHHVDTPLTRSLCILTSEVLNMPMEVIFEEDGRVFLGEKPMLRAETGMATRSLIDGEGENGDAYRVSVLPGGTLLAILADGMGHGGQARQESNQAVAMMHLCMEAGYTRQQTLAAVNGMMLCASPGDAFATVDLATIDLWSGRAAIDKMGAAASWLHRGDTLTPLKGDALPLGILEQVNAKTICLRLREGDTLILLTDGVEDSFESELALETAIRTSLLEKTSQAAANRLLSLSVMGGTGREDDRTAIVIRVERQPSRV